MAIDGVRPSIAGMTENGIVEVAKHAWGREGLIPLWFGEGDMDSPAVAIDATIAALQAGQTRYSPTRGVPPARAAVAAYMSRVHARPVGEERITLAAGGMHAICLAMQALIDPGDEIVIIHPLWPNGDSATEIVGGVRKHVSLKLTGDRWHLDMDALRSACGPKTKAIYVNTPNNPTGWVMSRDEMVDLLAFTRQHGIWILSDEVYGRITYDGRPAPSFIDIAEPEDRVIAFYTFSKNWAMTGWRLGWLAAPPSLAQVFENLTQFSTTGVAPFLQAGAAAVMEGGEPQCQAMVKMCDTGRKIVSQALSQLPNIHYAPPAGAFYAFFAVEGRKDSKALALDIIERANVGLAPGSAFGVGGEGYLRLCFASSAEMLSEAVDRLLPVLRSA
ncbi:MAG: pyridoxal phosphate-dependent aminotransferase [Pseudomonadota bacterium]